MVPVLTISQHLLTPPATTQPQPQQTQLRLLLYACMLECCYLLLITFSALPGLHLVMTPLAHMGQSSFGLGDWLQTLGGGVLAQHPWISSCLLGGTLVGVLGIYGGVIHFSQKFPDKNRNRYLFALILGGTLLFGITLLFQPLLFSDSIFTAIFSGRILTIYGTDPFSTIPNHFPHDPYFPWVVSGRDTPTIYVPFWLTICSLFAGLSSTPLTSLLLFKGLALCAHLLNVLLLWGILGRIAPERQILGTILYAWNPLALLECVGSGHNESLQLTFLLLASWCFVSSRRSDRAKSAGMRGRILPLSRLLGLCALFFLGLAISLNLVLLLLALLGLWFSVREERRLTYALSKLGGRILLMLLPALAFLIPFWRGADTFFALTASIDVAHFVNAPLALFAIPLRHIFLIIAGQGLPGFLQPTVAADMTIRATAIIIFVLLYANLFQKVRHTPVAREGGKQPEEDIPGFDTLLTCGCLALFWYLLLVSGSFWPWYLLWIVWIIALRRLDTLSMFVLTLSGTALFLYVFVGSSSAPLALYQSLLIFGLPFLVLPIVKQRKRENERMIVADGR